MGMLGDCRRMAERLTHTHILRDLPRGVDFALDIRTALPAFRADVVFDVGANVGQSALLFRAAFPEASIHCFEPVADSYRQLEVAVRGDDRVACHQTALGSAQRQGQMVLQGSADMFFLLDQARNLPAGEARTEAVAVDTLDDFCREHGFGQVSFLKVDTEGGDLDVLKGARAMLAAHRIDLVQAEAGMNPANSRHVPFESLKAYLESHGYFLFGIYHQKREWPTGEPHLRRTNPIFVSRSVIDRNRAARRPAPDTPPV